MRLFPAPLTLLSCFLSSPFSPSSLSEEETKLGNKVAAGAPSSDLSVYNLHVISVVTLSCRFYTVFNLQNYLIALQGMQAK